MMIIDCSDVERGWRVIFELTRTYKSDDFMLISLIRISFLFIAMYEDVPKEMHQLRLSKNLYLQRSVHILLTDSDYVFRNLNVSARRKHGRKMEALLLEATHTHSTIICCQHFAQNLHSQFTYQGDCLYRNVQCNFF